MRVILNKVPIEVEELDNKMIKHKPLYNELVNILEEANITLPMDLKLSKYPEVCKYPTKEVDTIVESLIQYHIRDIKKVQPYLSVKRMLEDIEQTHTINRAKELFDSITYIMLYDNEVLYNEYQDTFMYHNTVIPEVINLTNDIKKAIKYLKKTNISPGEIHTIFSVYSLYRDLESFNVFNLEHYLNLTNTPESFSSRLNKLRVG